MGIGLNSVNDAIKRSTNPPASTAFTMCGWLMVRSVIASTYQYMVSLEDSGVNANNGLYIGYTDAGAFHAYTSNGTSYVNFASNPTLNRWLFCSLSAFGGGSNQATARYGYIDSPFVSVSLSGASFTPALMTLGADSWNEFCDVIVGPFFVYDRYLDEAQLRAQMRSETPLWPDLNTWSIFSNTHDLLDRSGRRRDWSAGGTLTDESGPPISYGGRMWLLPFATASGAQTISPLGIASLEAFGSNTLTPGAVTISPSGVATSEAFGAAALNLNIAPSGVASAETFGSQVVAPGSVAILPSGITSAEAFGVATLAPGAVTVSPAGIASAEAFGTPSLALILLMTGIASAEAFGAHMITPGTVTVSPTGIVSAEAFGTAHLDLTLLAIAIATAEAFGNATLTPGTVTVSPSGIASAEAFGDAIITSGMIISPSAIASLEAFGSHTITPGAVTISPAGIISAEAFGLAQLNLTLLSIAIASAEAFGDATLSTGLIIAPSGIVSTEAFGGAIIAPGAVTISPSGIASSEVFGLTTLGLYVSPAGIGSAEAFGTLSLALILLMSGIPSVEAFGVATVTGGAGILRRRIMLVGAFDLVRVMSGEFSKKRTMSGSATGTIHLEGEI